LDGEVTDAAAASVDENPLTGRVAPSLQYGEGNLGGRTEDGRGQRVEVRWHGASQWASART
jgi:hypothetical protein